MGTANGPKPTTHISKQDLQRQVAGMRVQIKQLSAEVLKGQIVVATLRDVVRLLGFMIGKEVADPMKVVPKVPEVRRVMAKELRDLAKHLRGRADEIESYAVRIVEEVEEGPDEEASQ